MAVLPQVSFFFPCADIRVDEDNGSITIVDPLSILYFFPGTEFPSSSGVLFFFVEFKGGLGKFNCRIRCRDEKQRVVMETKPTTIEFTQDNRFAGIWSAFELPEFEVPDAGVYEFGLFANYAETPLATAVIRFLKEW